MAANILKKWGYDANPPEADGVLIPEKNANIDGVDRFPEGYLFKGKLKKIRIDSKSYLLSIPLLSSKKVKK